MSTGNLKIFGGRANAPLAQKISDYLGIALGAAKIQVFPDGELMVKLEEDVRGRDVFVIEPTCDPVNDTLMELLIFIDCPAGPRPSASRPSCRTSATPGRTARTKAARRSPPSWWPTSSPPPGPTAC